jgi:hypothetical protein
LREPGYMEECRFRLMIKIPNIFGLSNLFFKECGFVVIETGEKFMGRSIINRALSPSLVSTFIAKF